MFMATNPPTLSPLALIFGLRQIGLSHIVEQNSYYSHQSDKAIVGDERNHWRLLASH